MATSTKSAQHPLLARAQAQGLTPQQLAKRAQITVRSLRRYLAGARCSRNVAADLQYLLCAKTPEELGLVLARHPQRPSPVQARAAQIRELLAQGQTQTDVARAWGISRQRVSQLLARDRARN